MTKDKSGLADRVKERRRELGMTQEALAAETGMSQQGIHNIEASIVRRPRQLMELAWALRTSPEWLLWQKGPKAVSRPSQPDIPLAKVKRA